MEWSIMEYGVSVPEFTVPKQPVRNSEPDRWQNSIAGHSPLGKGPVSGKRRSGQVAGIESMKPMGHTGAGGGAAACVMQVVGVNLDQQSPLTMRTHCIYGEYEPSCYRIETFGWNSYRSEDEFCTLCALYAVNRKELMIEYKNEIDRVSQRIEYSV